MMRFLLVVHSDWYWRWTSQLWWHETRCSRSKTIKKVHKLTGKNGYLTLHCITEYHKTCVGKANEFLIRSVASSVADVGNLQHKARRQSIIKKSEENEISCGHFVVLWTPEFTTAWS